MANSDLVKALLRGLDVLECVGRSERGLTLRQIADTLRLKPPTAHNLIRTLLSRGYLQKTSQPLRYRLDGAVSLLARAHANSDLIRRAEPEFKRLTARYPDGAFSLSEFRAGDMTMLLYAASFQPGVVIRPTNHVFHPYCTATGLAYLAFAREGIETYRAIHPFSEGGAALWKNVKTLNAFLAQARRKGYVLCQFDGDEIIKIAAPVLDAHGAFRAAIAGNLAVSGGRVARQKTFVGDLIRLAARLNEKT